MTDIENNISTFPLIGSLIIFSALLSPAAFYGVIKGKIIYIYCYVYIWGLSSNFLTSPNQIILFSKDPMIFFTSIFSSVFILLGALVIFITSIRVWKRRKNIEDIENYWLISAIILIIVTITWMIIMEIAHRKYYFSYWFFMDIGFGIVGIFIGSILTLIGYGLKKVILKGEIL